MRNNLYDCPRCPTRQPLLLVNGVVTCYGCGGPVGLPPVAEGDTLPGVVAGIIYLLLLVGVAVVVVGSVLG